MFHNIMDQIGSNASGETGQDGPHSNQALDELKRMLTLELNQKCQEDIGTQETAKEAYITGLIKSHINGLDVIDRLDGCEDLAAWLWECWESDHNPVALTACTEVEAELLDLRPAGHPDRAASCGNLAMSLRTRYNQTGDTTQLEKAIELQEEALELRPAGHPDRFRSCANLAASLWTRYNNTGDTALLDKAIKLDGEALDLCPAGHPDRASSCANLAASLWTRYNQTGDSALLEKAIELEEEALDLCPAGHPDRASSCANLAASLRTRYTQTGDTTLLDKAIVLEEEALDLRSAGHPDRSMSCANLAVSLWTRYDQTGDSALLEKAISLDEEALELRPGGHPERAKSCANLASSLWTRYNQTRDTSLLDRAIKLQEEALDLCPGGHPDRASSCANLAASLRTRYNQTGDTKLLENAIKLQEEALDLRPAGHPERAKSCASLATSLWTRYNQIGDTALLDKAIELNHQALLSSTSSNPARWRYELDLARLGQISSPPLDWQVTISHLYQVFNASSYDGINHLLKHAIRTLLDIDTTSMSLQERQGLLAIHIRAIDIVALAASLALETPTQLHHTLYGVSLGPATLSLAQTLNELPTGIQSLERARGVIWSQMLHLRNPQLDRVPNELAVKLRGLLHNTASQEHSLPEGVESNPSVPRGRSSNYSQQNQLQDVIRQIRSLPGMSDFMRGPDLNTLIGVGAQHPVVILVASPRECCALLLMSGARLAHVAMPGVTLQILQDLTFDGLASHKRGTPAGSDSLDRGMKVTKGASPAHSRLAKLWRAVVKPILETLSFSVCTLLHNFSFALLTMLHSKHEVAVDQEFTGVPLALSHSSLFMRRVFTKARTRNAAPTTSSRRTPPP
jgi:hypothetical protein